MIWIGEVEFRGIERGWKVRDIGYLVRTGDYVMRTADPCRMRLQLCACASLIVEILLLKDNAVATRHK